MQFCIQMQVSVLLAQENSPRCFSAFTLNEGSAYTNCVFQETLALLYL